MPGYFISGGTRQKHAFVRGPKEIKSSIELHLEEHIPLSPEEATFDFEVVGYNASKNELHVNIAVLPSKVVDAYIGLFEEAGLCPVVLGTEADAASAAVIPKKEKGTFLVVDFGYRRSGFYVVSDWAEIVYKATDYYAPEWERSILWNDPEIDINWPLLPDIEVCLSDKDQRGKCLSEAELFE